MRHTPAIVVALSLSTPAAADVCFDLNNVQEMKLRGTIMQSRTIVEEEGQPPHKYLVIVFDQPLCILGERPATFIPVMADGNMKTIDKDWIGHHVDVTATVMVQVELDAIVHRLTDVVE
jgi:hypothetical protein